MFGNFLYCLKDWVAHLKLVHENFEDKSFWFNLNTCVYIDNIREHKRLWMLHHKESEMFAAMAESERTKKYEKMFGVSFSEVYYYKAAQEELEALVHLSAYIAATHPYTSKDLGAIAVSAVNLLRKAGEVEAAKNAAIRYMSDVRVPRCFNSSSKQFLTCQSNLK